MTEKPNGTWTHKDVILEMHLVSELFNRWEHEWIEMFNGETEWDELQLYQFTGHG